METAEGIFGWADVNCPGQPCSGTKWYEDKRGARRCVAARAVPEGSVNL